MAEKKTKTKTKTTILVLDRQTGDWVTQEQLKERCQEQPATAGNRA